VPRACVAGRGAPYASGVGRLDGVKRVSEVIVLILGTALLRKTQGEVITSVQRRRGWSRAEKERIIAAALGPVAVASEVALGGRDSYEPAVSVKTRRIVMNLRKNGKGPMRLAPIIRPEPV